MDRYTRKLAPKLDADVVCENNGGGVAWRWCLRIQGTIIAMSDTGHQTPELAAASCLNFAADQFGVSPPPAKGVQN